MTRRPGDKRTQETSATTIDPAHSHAVLQRVANRPSIQVIATELYLLLAPLDWSLRLCIFYPSTMAAQLPLDIAGVLAIRFEVSTVVRVTEIVR